MSNTDRVPVDIGEHDWLMYLLYGMTVLTIVMGIVDSPGLMLTIASAIGFVAVVFVVTVSVGYGVYRVKRRVV